MMIDSATHLTGKIPFVIPCTNALWGVYYYMGSLMYYWIYEWFAPKRGTWFKPPIFFNREELVAAFPYINPKYSIGVVYEDGSFNDSRLLLAALLTATVGNGGEMPDGFVPGNVLNRAEFVEFLKN
jgi:glycerol-3-phosphate dehydrogenase